MLRTASRTIRARRESKRTTFFQMITFNEFSRLPPRSPRCLSASAQRRDHQ